ncbi:glycosyltransferase family 2 protein [Azohydromonas sediminis]|uniref:glycosyltransferase family 2 protein n=1 Tax=Azohydromonas sediminis TaxID=2259674 RepID=UPI000E65582B|nr:glycosyltransferase family 2 protein [Azohydromonas sediminis]
MSLHLFKSKDPEPEFPPARAKRDVVVVSAISDGEWSGMADLLDSLATYLGCSYAVVVADDATTDGSHERLLDAGCWVVRNPRKLYLEGLHVTLARAFSEAHRLFDAKVILKMDPDALLIGPGLPEVLQAAFAADASIGLLGTFRVDWNGEPRDASFWDERMIRQRADLGRPIAMAERNGYRIGEGVQGGAYAVAPRCLAEIVERGWWAGRDGYRPARGGGKHIAEDSLFTMLVYAAGFKAADIGGPGQPFGIWHVGLPMPPEQLVAQGRLVAHAIKYRDEVSLAARDYFRARRLDHVARHGGNRHGP